MDKQNLLSLIDQKIEDGIISAEEISSHLANGIKVSSDKTEDTSTAKITYVLYIVGALIASVGIFVLLAQYWVAIGFFGRVGVTLGFALITYNYALFLKGMEHRILSQVLFTVSAILAPIGIAIVYSEMGYLLGVKTHMVISFAMVLIFAFAYLYTKRNILFLIMIASASWGYFATLAWLNLDSSTMFKWSLSLIGISYVLFAYYLEQKTKINSTLTSPEKKERDIIQKIIYLVGTTGVLGSVLSMGGVFDLLVLIPIFGAIYSSVYLKSKSMLILSTLFLIAYIIKITSKYFADSIGWSFALIVVGILIIAVGYFALYLNKKYLQKSKVTTGESA